MCSMKNNILGGNNLKIHPLLEGKLIRGEEETFSKKSSVLNTFILNAIKEITHTLTEMFQYKLISDKSEDLGKTEYFFISIVVGVPVTPV